MNDKGYLCWLMNQAQLVAEGMDGYLLLCEILHRTSFLSYISMDENRGEEGMELREEWADTDGGDADELTDVTPYSATMLEILVILGRRMAFEMADSQWEADTGKWVMELLENAGLDIFTNLRLEDDPNGEALVQRKLYDIIHRRYDRNGRGSFFPLHQAEYNQRDSELLIQMNNYLEENYDIS